MKYLVAFIFLLLMISDNHNLHAQLIKINLPDKAYDIAASGINVYTCTDSSGVYLSTNNGTTWTSSNNGLTSLICYDIFTSGSALYVSTADGLFLSTDNGTNWSFAFSLKE